MTAAVARVATSADHPLLSGYVAHCQALQVSDRALRERLRLARQFLACYPDLDAWMARPLDARLADLRRIRAWSLLGYAVLAGTCASTSTCWSPRTSAASAARPRRCSPTMSPAPGRPVSRRALSKGQSDVKPPVKSQVSALGTGSQTDYSVPS